MERSDMVEVVALDACAACGGGELTPAFRREGVRHNSLARVTAEASGAEPAFLAAFRTVDWKVCRRCGLAFAGRRPPSEGVADWYLPLFKISEERGYDTYPMPADYVASKLESHCRLYELLKREGVLKPGARVLQVRCATGDVLKLARDELGCDVWGLDFFPSCVTHANALLGEERVAQMTGPEPENPFPQKTFDVIISNHMVTHSHAPAMLVGRFESWLADDGALVVLNEPDHSLTLASRKSYARGINFFHKQLFTEATFVSSMRAWGFEPSRVTAAGPEGKKLRKNMMFVCRKRGPDGGAEGDWRASVGMLRAWSRRRWVSDAINALKPTRA